MSRLAVELNKFKKLKVLILKGNRLNHFNIPKRYLSYKHLIRLSTSYDDQFNETLSQSYNYKNYKDYNRFANNQDHQFTQFAAADNRLFIENKIEVFPKLNLLDLSENKIEILAPTAFKLLPKLIHLNLMFNNIQKIYGRSFIFTNNQTEMQGSDNEAIITDLDRIFDQNVDDYLKNKSISSKQSKPASDQFYNYGTFSFEHQPNKTAANSSSLNASVGEKESADEIVNIYLGGNDLDCGKINQFAFVKIDKKFTLHLDFNDFSYICEDLFENLLFNAHLQWVNLNKNAIKCLHCGNRWLFSAKIRHESQSNIDLYERLKEDKINRFKTRLYGKNYTTQHTILQPIVTGSQDIKAIKYDVFKLANVKCVNLLNYDLSSQLANKPSEIVHLQDFNLNSFSHCNLKRKQLINSLKHFASFLKAFNVINAVNVERINEILE